VLVTIAQDCGDFTTARGRHVRILLLELEKLRARWGSRWAREAVEVRFFGTDLPICDVSVPISIGGKADPDRTLRNTLILKIRALEVK
jgi:hypothetical protein